MSSSGPFLPPSPPPGGLGGVVSPFFNNPYFDWLPSIVVVTEDLSFSLIKLRDWIMANLYDPKSKSNPSIDIRSKEMDSRLSFEQVFGSARPETNILVYGGAFGSTARTQQINEWAQAEDISALRGLTDREISRIDLHELTKHGKVESLRYLAMERGVNLLNQKENISGQNIIYTAAQYGQVPVLKFVHSLGLGLNQGIKGTKLLPAHIAIRYGQVEVLRYLDEMGILYTTAIPKPDRWRYELFLRTPLQMAILSGSVETAEHLRQRGCDVNELDDSNNARTLAHIAVDFLCRGIGSDGPSEYQLRQMISIIRWLHEHAVNLNLPDNQDQTIAHYVGNVFATRERGHNWTGLYNQAKRELEAMGVDFSVRNRDGKLADEIFYKRSDDLREAFLAPPEPVPDYSD